MTAKKFCGRGLPETPSIAACVQRLGTIRVLGGVVLADIAKHVANALHDERQLSVDETLDSIRYVFNAEMLNPTDEAKGHFV